MRRYGILIIHSPYSLIFSKIGSKFFIHNILWFYKIRHLTKRFDLFLILFPTAVIVWTSSDKYYSFLSLSLPILSILSYNLKNSLPSVVVWNALITSSYESSPLPSNSARYSRTCCELIIVICINFVFPFGSKAAVSICAIMFSLLLWCLLFANLSKNNMFVPCLVH